MKKDEVKKILNLPPFIQTKTGEAVLIVSDNKLTHYGYFTIDNKHDHFEKADNNQWYFYDNKAKEIILIDGVKIDSIHYLSSIASRNLSFYKKQSE